eukprot:13899623-Alexandrium_andersonii.AAC.1
MAGAGGAWGWITGRGASLCSVGTGGTAEPVAGVSKRRPWRLIASRRRAKSRRISSLVILPSGRTSTVGSGRVGCGSPRSAAAAARATSSARSSSRRSLEAA